MAKYSIPATDGETIHTVMLRSNQHTLVVDAAGNTGILNIEARMGSTGDWLPVCSLTLGEQSTWAFTGPVQAWRFRLAGTSGNGSPITVEDVGGKLGQYGEGYGPTVTAFPADNLAGNRLRVDVGEAGFFEGRQYAMDFEISVPNQGMVALKFELPVDTIILESHLFVDAGTLRYEVYGPGAVESSPFDTRVPTYPLNTMTGVLSRPASTRISTGGTVNVSGSQRSSLRRVRTTNATAAQTSVGGATGLSRGLGPGVAYIVMTQLANTVGATTGVLTIKFEERP